MACVGEGIGELIGPYGITQLYVCNSGNNRVHIFDLDHSSSFMPYYTHAVDCCLIAPVLFLMFPLLFTRCQNQTICYHKSASLDHTTLSVILKLRRLQCLCTDCRLDVVNSDPHTELMGTSICLNAFTLCGIVNINQL